MLNNTMSKVATSKSVKSKQVSIEAVKAKPVVCKVEAVKAKPVEVKVEESVVAPVEVPEVAVVVEETIRERLEHLIQARTDDITRAKSEIVALRKLMKDHELKIKSVSKKVKKVKGPKDYSKMKRPTGFAAPVLVSAELYKFLVKTKATMKDPEFTPSSKEEEDNWPRIAVKDKKPVARTDIISHINKYIKENNLRNPAHKNEIVPDAELLSIFSEPTEIDPTNPVRKIFTYRQLQTTFNHHFPQKKVVVA